MRIYGKVPALQMTVGEQDSPESIAFLTDVLKVNQQQFHKNERLDFFFSTEQYEALCKQEHPEELLLRDLQNHVREIWEKDCEDSRVRIYIASHKLIPFPHNPAYQPVIVGALSHMVPPTVVTDATGQNISVKNSCYSELTALYWAWKNDKLKDYIGLAHYRRYFRTMQPSDAVGYDALLSEKEILEIMKDHDIIVLAPFLFKAAPVGVCYRINHCATDLDAARRVLQQHYSDYLTAFDAVMDSRFLYCCNMFVTSRAIFCEYMQWLFDVLFRVEKEVGGFMNRDTYQRRAPGFLAERLMNVYIIRNSLRVQEAPLLYKNF